VYKNNNECIAAISTPSGNGGIAIIRLSGENAFFIADKVFCRNKLGVLSSFVENMADHTVAHGYIFDFSSGAGELVDECLVTKMASPRTFTTEDTVEINCHGGYQVALKTLRLLLANGARAAEPGEFTKRAFLNGRIDLTEAEAVMDIINAKTEKSLKAASNGLSGRLGKEISDICGKLTEAEADLDVSVDYPEYEFDEEMGPLALSIVKDTLIKLRKLSGTYERGRLAKEGIKLVIAGSPNAGKSSLMNIFSGTERSIVTDIPGTTRDTIEELVQFDGFPVWVTDTAGIRETEDVVEKIGVDRAKLALQDADLVIYMVDVSTDPDFSDIPNLSSKNTIVIANKIDIGTSGISKLKDNFKEFRIVEISAKTGEGTEVLFNTIKDMLNIGEIDFNHENIITSERHKQLVDEAITLLESCVSSSESGMPLDFFSCDLRLANEKLCEILGKNISEELVSNIFSRFCVGK